MVRKAGEDTPRAGRREFGAGAGVVTRRAALESRRPLVTAHLLQARKELQVAKVDARDAAAELTRYQARLVELRERESQLDAAFEKAPFDFWIRDREGRCIFQNSISRQHWGNQLGKTPEESGLPAKVVALWQRNNRRAYAGKVVRGEVAYDQGGRRRWYYQIIAPFRVGRKICGILGFNIDITARKQALEALKKVRETLEQRVRERTRELMAANRALKESQQECRQLFNTIPDAVIVFDRSTRRVLEVNEAALRLYGFTRDEFLRLKETDLVAAAGQPEERLKECPANTRPRIGSTIHKTKEGRTFPVEISSGKFVINGQEAVCYIVRDITERKQVEEALRKSEQQLSDFFAESPMGLLWVASDGVILRANRAQAELLGCSETDLIGEHVSKMFVDSDVAEDLLQRLGRNETIRNYRARVRTRNGTLKFIRLDCNGLWEQGRLVYSRWFARDISREVELEREIVAITERERRRLGQDLHDDLGQQLAAIGFLCGTLARNLAGRGDPAAAQAEEIASLARRAIRQTHELARGLSPLSPEPNGLMIALRELAANTERVFRRNCRFNCPWPVLVHDPLVAVHLFRIAQEAVGNAIKHAKAQNIEIGLRAQGRKIVLGITDDGIGIAKRPREHKGMGLKIMQYRAGVIGGSLIVQRGQNGGTTVVCTVLDGRVTGGAGETK